MGIEQFNLSESSKRNTMKTLEIFRKMRQAAIIVELQRDDPIVGTGQNVLADVEILGQIAAAHLWGLVNAPFKDMCEWDDKLGFYAEKYSKYSGLTKRNSPPECFVGRIEYFMSRIALSIDLDGVEAFQHYFLEQNGIEDIGVQSVFNKKFGIFAPLSSDYFMALILHTYLRAKESVEVFNLKPSIITTDGSFVLLPKNADGSGCFSCLDNVSVAIDFDGPEGETRKQLSKGVSVAYSGKKIWGGVLVR